MSFVSDFPIVYNFQKASDKNLLIRNVSSNCNHNQSTFLLVFRHQLPPKMVAIGARNSKLAPGFEISSVDDLTVDGGSEKKQLSVFK